MPPCLKKTEAHGSFAASECIRPKAELQVTIFIVNRLSRQEAKGAGGYGGAASYGGAAVDRPPTFRSLACNNGY